MKAKREIKRGGPNSRSIMEQCGGPPPLFPSPALVHPDEGAKALVQSKTWRLGLSYFCILLSAFYFGAQAQLALDWSTIDGGGGTSTNGQYSLSGTIGQPDAGGPMTNGQYSVTGGFWALPQAVQTEGAPTLAIVPFGAGQAQISWTPATGTNWILQERLSLTAGTWTNSPSGATNPVTVPAAVPAKFFRLHKP